VHRDDLQAALGVHRLELGFPQLEHLRRRLERVEAGPVRPLFAPNAAGLALYEHALACAREIGFAPGHGTVGGGSDGNFTGALGIPTLDGLGVCGDGFHTDAEHLDLASVVPRARPLSALLRTLR